MTRKAETFVLLCLVALAGPSGAEDAITGTWRGTSLCSDRQAAPACNDEQVVYLIRPSQAKPGAVSVEMDKIVAGQREEMATLDFSRDARSGDWASEVETPRAHMLWRLALRGDALEGSLTLLPARAVVRKLSLRREK